MFAAFAANCPPAWQSQAIRIQSEGFAKPSDTSWVERGEQNALRCFDGWGGWELAAFGTSEVERGEQNALRCFDGWGSWELAAFGTSGEERGEQNALRCFDGWGGQKSACFFAEKL